MYGSNNMKKSVVFNNQFNLKFGGQFELENGGQFAPELVVNLHWKVVVNLTGFSTPGTLLVTLSQFYNGGISQCRNTNIQKMFVMIGSAEKAGSGVSKIISCWVSAH